MDDSKPDLSGLRASVSGWLFRADIALRPGKLNAQDAEAMRAHRESLEAGRDEMMVALAKITPDFPAEAAEIERCAAQMLHAASWIWQLHSAPTPNSRDTVRRAVIKKENPKRAREGRKNSDKTKAIDAAFGSARPLNYDGKKPVIVARRVREEMKRILREKYGNGVKCISARAVYDRLKAIPKIG